ncbi:hypothetical protein F4803DRAFT_506387 [Xylaria telfairii]|nr:hypothetical protein F4803DRAFT_506387 [Xylaria telfairii]
MSSNSSVTDLAPSRPVARRRPHRKSRNGCDLCKKRKVKCDEVKPVCGGCVRFCLVCTSTTVPEKQVHDAEEPPTRRPRGRPRKNWQNITMEEESPPASSSSNTVAAGSVVGSGEAANDPGIITGVHDLNVDDLQLFSHFLLADGTFGGHQWRQYCINIGFEFPMVLHLALALSALDLRRLHPDHVVKYERLADSHFAKGLNSVRELLPAIDHHNCVALYFSTSFVFGITFAKGPTPGHLLVTVDNCDVAWWSLIQGVRFVIEKMGFEAILGSTPPAQQEEEEPIPQPVVRLVQWEEPVGQLWNLLTEAPNLELQTYQGMLIHLSHCFREIFGTMESPIGGINGKLQDVITWLYRMEERFASLLQSKEPVALIFLGYFAVLLNSLEYLWLMRGWGKHIVEQVEDALSTEYRHWVIWPKEEVAAVIEIRRRLDNTEDE